MYEREKINRKAFLTGCGQAFLGLGIGASCGKSASQAKEVSPSGAQVEASPETARTKPAIAYRSLGKAGIKVTEIGFGASRTMDPSLVHHALEVGMNFIDTGRAYANGPNEFMVGKVLRKELRVD